MMDVTVETDGLAPIAEAAATLMTKLAGRPCEAIGGMITDQVSYWRWSNRVRIMESVARKLQSRKLEARPLPPSFCFPLLEDAGDADGDELQELWSNLIVSAVENEAAAKRSFVEILKRMSAPEARLMKLLAASPAKAVISTCGSHVPSSHDTVGGVPLDELGIKDAPDFLAVLSFLAASGCVVVESATKSTSSSRMGHDPLALNPAIVYRRTIKIWLSSFGAAFVTSCSEVQVNPNSVKEPWAVTDDAKKMAFEAGRSSLLVD